MSTKKSHQDAPQTQTKQQTALYLPADLRLRLARYLAEKHGGKMNGRNQLILDAIHEKLSKEGY